VLDLGCGSGQFMRIALCHSIEVGLDLSEGQLARAWASNCYERLECADAAEMPFPPGLFGTVVSISALEHMRRPAAVVEEVFRVLRPGGLFVGTVLLSDLHAHLFYPALLQRVGLAVVGRLYRRLQDRAFQHITLLSQEDWEGLLSRAGFELLSSKKILCPRMTRLWDLLLLAAVPYRLFDRLGSQLVWHPGRFRSLAWRLSRNLINAEEPEGSDLFFVARKPAASCGNVLSEEPGLGTCQALDPVGSVAEMSRA
jgi:SAM-dependent methyltransferase